MELTEAVRVYECDADGWVGTERRCETCSKFVSRRDEDGCENCFAEVEEVEVVTDHDGTLIKAEDYKSNGKSLAERNKAASEKSKKDAAKKAKTALDALLSETTETTWANIAVGQRIAATDWKGNIDTFQDAKVVSIMVAGANAMAPVAPGSLIVMTDHYGPRIESHSPDDSVLIRNAAPEPTTIEPVEERFSVSLGSDTHGSSGIKFVSANVSLAATSVRNVYMGEISGKNSQHSGYETIIGSFHDPAEARAFGKAAREAAVELRKVVLVDDLEELAVELTDNDDILSHVPTRYATFLVGKDDMMGGDGVRVSTSTSVRSTQSFAVLSPNALDGIAKAADLIAEKLATLLDVKEK